MAYTYDVESVHEVAAEAGPLLEAHYREVAHYQDKVALAPIWEQYKQLERKGDFILMCARKDGELVGYAGWFVRMHPHYAGCMIGANDVIYLKPEHRRGRVGLRLITESEYLLKVLGVDRVTWHVKPSLDWSPILKRLGYQLEEMVYGKYTGK
jgi:GNAT superfamily N-acetyltransferase